jgi:serine/threonine protein kinase
MPRAIRTEASALARYRAEEVLGHGGMAVVHRGWDDELDRPVALKVLAENLANDESFRRRFLREARVAARLAHPNIVQVYDSGELDGRLMIVMEYVEGESLGHLLERRGNVPPAEAVELALQLCSGLAHAHAAGLVHRDVKPQNLLLREDGVLKIADFGIAHVDHGTELTEAGTILGTATYLAPEQAAGEKVTASADIYAAGVVLYELLTGRPPQAYESLAQLLIDRAERSVAPLRELAPEVRPELEAVVMRCLARLPEYRPSSAAELGEQLEHTLGSEAPTAVARTEEYEAQRPRRRLPWVAAAAALVVLGIALGLGLSLGGAERRTPSPAPSISKPPAEQARDLSAWLRRHSG